MLNLELWGLYLGPEIKLTRDTWNKEEHILESSLSIYSPVRPFTGLCHLFWEFTIGGAGMYRRFFASFWTGFLPFDVFTKWSFSFFFLLCYQWRRKISNSVRIQWAPFICSALCLERYFFSSAMTFMSTYPHLEKFTFFNGREKPL